MTELGARESIGVRPPDAVEVTVDMIRMSADKPTRLVYLREVDQDRWMIIGVGVPEADAMALVLQGRHAPRPLSHDLMLHLVESGGLKLDRVTVTHAVDGTYYATLTLRRRRGASLELDARPSDAIALALRANAPIYASADLLAPLPQWEPTPLVEPKRVLLATADAGTSNLITQALRDKGHTVEVASTGEAARQALRENRFDGIMADWNLPDSSGHRLLQTAKEIQAGIPTIVLKAADDTLIKEDADLWRVPDGFATKPLGVDTLLRTVARAIGTRKDGASDRKPDG